VIAKVVVVVIAIFSVSLGSWSQTFPDLVVDGATETVYLSGDKYFRSVSVVEGATLSYEPSDREASLRITCGSMLVDEGSTIWAGYFYPGFDQRGTPDVEVVNEYGETQGNGAGTYGGRGFNYFDRTKPPYGDPLNFEINPGSRGTYGETVRFWFSGWHVLPGAGGGLGGGMVTLIGNTVTISGRIVADGEGGRGDPCGLQWAGYSGSGGGILIVARNLTIAESARITANGGEYPIKERCWIPDFPIHYYQEAVGKRDGGGGRIKIFYEEGTISPEAIIEAKGWEDGTVHIQQVRSIDQLLNPGDLNGDGVTNHEDLFILQQSWQQAVTPIPSPEETPTPTATPAP